MTLQSPHSTEQRKIAVRSHARAAVAWGGAGLAAAVGGLLVSQIGISIIAAAVSLAGVGVNYGRIRAIINYRDQW
ncbi:hypothetical protein N7326_01945 [Corynebacterium sp. ES2794-CONJ1]|uniref:hypothetical protein n=1 Tax=unclassified Corynebacterium TaxID=2624378 RepID=UPI002166CEC4|nr:MULTISPECIES: hypothetical protein [unclassified Corynebacterium]MCS4489039.1 hypothetical protein [Corynebacterium sp. ES2775-CONJ]MCS4490852.1 hypothetical protein [Corynebacterium sp. ES2715-CONJ3]MCS4531265.1 hypothetical protein [Corynebacterium sp. ES2730-CONJ]MCU9518634.1 hypothetical protein [Corynebacterium sp. ES2794-CONJ1]